MPAGLNKTVSRLAALAVLLPILAGVWFALPMFLPMYRWLKVDLGAISRQAGVPESRLATRYQMHVRYHPRGDGDPLPWQIIDSTPTFNSVHTSSEDEAEVLVRCTFVSENDGKPPGTTFINSTFKDRYFRCRALRLPPGTLGFNAKRPVVIYERMSLDKLDIGSADMMQSAVRSWISDDDWEERDDGWQPR